MKVILVTDKVDTLVHGRIVFQTDGGGTELDVATIVTSSALWERLAEILKLGAIARADTFDTRKLSIT